MTIKVNNVEIYEDSFPLAYITMRSDSQFYKSGAKSLQKAGASAGNLKRVAENGSTYCDFQNLKKEYSISKWSFM